MTGRRLLSALAVALLATTIAGGWLAWRARAVDEAHHQAAAVAEKVALATTTYRYDQFDHGVEKVLGLSTDPFARQYRSAAKTLKPLVVSAQSSATGRIVGSGVNSASTSKVVVVVLIDQRVRTGENRRVDRSRMIITVRKIHDIWMVSELDLV